MAVLERLSIRGIRSFGPNDEEKLKFSTPLTLFLGQNGCGKTTIIECLKYALTGDLPTGTGNGRGFINDPKLSNKSSTKGSIKVRFRDYKGDFITVGKFVEVSTQSGGKLSFRSLNPSIRWEDGKGNKDAEDIGGRCANIDAYCSQKLNVSKAIINNVIFCHQENSAWPLEEAKKLKERFDEIFGSTEYNKCVEKLRKLIKEKKNHIKVLNEQFEAKKLAKKNVEKIKDTLAVREEQLHTIRGVIEQKEREIEPLEERIKEICDLEDVLSTLHQNLTGFEKTLEGVVEHQQALRRHLVHEFEGSDEALNSEIKSFISNQGNIGKTISDMETKKHQIESALAEISKQLQILQMTFGQLKEEENQHCKRLREMQDLIEKAKVKLNLVDNEEEATVDILLSLKSALKIEEYTFSKFAGEKESEEQKLQQAIDSVRVNNASAKENFSSKDKAISEFEKKIVETKLKLQKLAISNSQILDIDNKIRNLEEALTKRKAGFDEHQQTQEIEELDTDIQQKEKLQNQLEREHRTLQQNYITEQRIDHENSSIIDKKGEIGHIREKHEQSFRTLFGDNIPEDNFEHSIKKIQHTEDAKVKNLTKGISDYEKKVTTLEATVQHTQERIENQKEELKLNQGKIDQLCKGKRFSEVLQESYNRKEKLQKDKGTYRSAKTLFEEFINQFERETPCCPVCETDFSEKKGMVPSIVRRLKSKIEELPEKLIVIDRDLKKEEQLYNKLQQLQPVSNNIELLQEAKIPILEQDLHESIEKLDETKMELASQKNDLLEPQNLVDTCRKIFSDAALLDRLTIELKKSDNSIANLRRELVQVPSNRTLDEAETELANLKSDLSNLRRKYKNKRDLLDETKRIIQGVNANLQTETQKKLEAQKLLQEKPLLEKQMKEYKENKVRVEQEKKSLIVSVESLEIELKQAEGNRSDVVKRNKKEMEKKRLDLENHKRMVDDIQKLHNAVERYENGDGKKSLEDIVQDIGETREKIIKMENARDVLTKTITTKKEDLASQESRLRALNDNKELRESKQKGEKLKEEINILKTKIGKHNYKSVFEEKKRIKDKMESKRQDISVRCGEQKKIQENIRELEAELNKKENKMAVKEFLKKYYELRVEQLAVDDLNVYTEALERAILKFHQERMVQINKTIRELWRSIYKGNDIDYIEIQTEDDIGGGGKKRRSYSYKVVEVKKGVELEMRGRCSAGQRVLACLVIRMALAETFSANCGILALDEPTTNLDRVNISSLSDALSKIITAREKQKNFQLLVITHDEDFLQTLTRDQSVSHYFRVQRNAEGFSQIKKEVL